MGVELARYVVDAVVLEGRGVREVARSVDRSPGWVSGRVRAFRLGGYPALAPRSRAPRRQASKMPEHIEDEVVALRKELIELGLDAGAHTIAYHLSSRHGIVASTSSIWRALKRRGFVTASPQKKPRSAWLRFESEMPNETWRTDITHWHLADGTTVDILDFIDDHSRVVVGADVRFTTKAQDVVDSFHQAGAKWGLPASVLSDNGAVFTARSRKGRVTFEVHLAKMGIDYKHSRPYHPQTCGKIERFHQTLKRWLAKQSPAATIEDLQAQVDTFVDYYNRHRPHRACGRRPPIERFRATPKATPGTPVAKRHLRVRTDKIDSGGKVTLRHDSKLLKIGVGRPWAGTRVRLYVNDLEVRVVTMEGELLRKLILDPSRTYQPQT